MDDVLCRHMQVCCPPAPPAPLTFPSLSTEPNHPTYPNPNPNPHPEPLALPRTLTRWM